jgi:hypothetical protein
MDARVYAVDDVQIIFDRRFPPGIHVTYSAVVNTGGWSIFRLVPRMYVHPPEDGLWDFDCIAQMPRPGQIVTQEFVRHEKLSAAFWPTPKWCTGVRIHGSTNTAESNEESKSLLGLMRVSSDDAGAVASERFVPFPMRDPGDAFPMLDPGDGFPWAVELASSRSSGGSARGGKELDKPISQLLGMLYRVYFDGDAITKDFRPNRVNLVIEKGGSKIQDVWFG